MWKDEPQATRGPANTAQGAPLAGVRVLDLTRLLPGPMCTLHLADLGADVLKIEDLGLGDYAAAGVREQVNRNKRGLRIDLKHPEGVATLQACNAATAAGYVLGAELRACGVEIIFGGDTDAAIDHFRCCVEALAEFFRRAIAEHRELAGQRQAAEAVGHGHPLGVAAVA